MNTVTKKKNFIDLNSSKKIVAVFFLTPKFLVFFDRKTNRTKF